MNKQEIESALRLFKGYVVDDEQRINTMDAKLSILTVTAPAGLIFDDMTYYISLDTITEAIKQYGKDATKWNATFHKSFKKVLEAPIGQLIGEQLIHYFTTYGFEALGIYDKDLVYIPNEQLDLPELEEDLPLIVIHRYTAEQIQEKLMTLLTSGIALSEDTVNDIMTLSNYLDTNRFDEIKNREVRIALYDKYGIVPKNNIEFLRYVVYKTLNTTLLIKNKEMIESLKKADITNIYGYLSSYVMRPNGYEKLAEIFLRYKDIFLAFKRDAKESMYAKQINKIINKISKLTPKYHKPLKQNILDKLTTIDDLETVLEKRNEIIENLNNIPVFRQVRILNAISYRLYGEKSMVYKVRNGKGFVKAIDSQLDGDKVKALRELYSTIYVHLTTRLVKTLEGKTVYIPNNLEYAVPTSEKQFNGNIPEGSYIEVPREDNVVLGIHWTNLNNERVDLDLHSQNRNEQYGWNTAYRSNSGDFAFSGDVTDAPGPKGATELFFVSRDCTPRSFLLTVTDYTSNKDTVPFDFMIAKCDDNQIDKNYVVDPNNILTIIHNKLERSISGGYYGKNEMTIGYIEINEKTIRIYFNDFSLGDSIVTRQNDVTRGAYDYISSYKDIQMKLTTLLEDCGAVVVNTPTVEKLEEVEVKNDEGDKDILYKKVNVPCDIDLSLENITKETIIKLLSEEV